MRISDWSSDVCSSDLIAADDRQPAGAGAVEQLAAVDDGMILDAGMAAHDTRKDARPRADIGGRIDGRSEEHTSELQSLMRISYAVFCLKKKKTHTIHTYTHTTIETNHLTRTLINRKN